MTTVGLTFEKVTEKKKPVKNETAKPEKDKK